MRNDRFATSALTQLNLRSSATCGMGEHPLYVVAHSRRRFVSRQINRIQRVNPNIYPFVKTKTHEMQEKLNVRIQANVSSRRRA